jgi:tetratricopeptide (TPR) repeat protein
LPLQAQGEFAPLQEQLAPALELPGQPVKRGTMAHQHIVYMMMTDSAAQSRDAERLQLYAPKLEELATRDEHLPYLAVAHRAQGIAHRLAGDPVEAVARLNKAMEIFTMLQAGWQIGRTYFEMGEAAQSLSDSERAQGYFNQALAAFEAMKAMPDIERTRAALGLLNKSTHL